MIGLPYGEKTMTICYAVFIWYRNVTDGQTDRFAISISRVSMLMRDKKNHTLFKLKALPTSGVEFWGLHIKVTGAGKGGRATYCVAIELHLFVQNVLIRVKLSQKRNRGTLQVLSDRYSTVVFFSNPLNMKLILSQRDHAMLHVIEHFTNLLKVTQGHSKWHP